jgi:hypothetical protein
LIAAKFGRGSRLLFEYFQIPRTGNWLARGRKFRMEGLGGVKGQQLRLDTIATIPTQKLPAACLFLSYHSNLRVLRTLNREVGSK